MVLQAKPFITVCKGHLLLPCCEKMFFKFDEQKLISSNIVLLATKTFTIKLNEVVFV